MHADHRFPFVDGIERRPAWTGVASITSNYSDAVLRSGGVRGREGVGGCYLKAWGRGAAVT